MPLVGVGCEGQLHTLAGGTMSSSTVSIRPSSTSTPAVPAAPTIVAPLPADVVAVLMSEASGFKLVRAAWGRHRIDNLRALWRQWAVFARCHQIDPLDPADTDLVAYVEAKAAAGHAFSSVRNTLMCVAHVTDRTWTVTRRTIAAHRHLADLWSDGEFDPAIRQAPLLSVGAVAELCDAAPRDTSRQPGPTTTLMAARDDFLVRLVYATSPTATVHAALLATGTEMWWWMSCGRSSSSRTRRARSRSWTGSRTS